MEHDPEVQALIRRWTAPEVPAELDGRMMARFLKRRRSMWLRRLEFRVSLPVPVVAASMVLLVVAGVWWGYQSRGRSGFRERMGGFEPVAAPALTVTRAEVMR